MPHHHLEFHHAAPLLRMPLRREGSVGYALVELFDKRTLIHAKYVHLRGERKRGRFNAILSTRMSLFINISVLLHLVKDNLLLILELELLFSIGSLWSVGTLNLMSTNSVPRPEGPTCTHTGSNYEDRA